MGNKTGLVAFEWTREMVRDVLVVKSFTTQTYRKCLELYFGKGQKWEKDSVSLTDMYEFAEAYREYFRGTEKEVYSNVQYIAGQKVKRNSLAFELGYESWGTRNSEYGKKTYVNIYKYGTKEYTEYEFGWFEKHLQV